MNYVEKVQKSERIKSDQYIIDGDNGRYEYSYNEQFLLHRNLNNVFYKSTLKMTFDKCYLFNNYTRELTTKSIYRNITIKELETNEEKLKNFLDQITELTDPIEEKQTLNFTINYAKKNDSYFTFLELELLSSKEKDEMVLPVKKWKFKSSYNSYQDSYFAFIADSWSHLKVILTDKLFQKDDKVFGSLYLATMDEFNGMVSRRGTIIYPNLDKYDTLPFDLDGEEHDLTQWTFSPYYEDSRLGPNENPHDKIGLFFNYHRFNLIGKDDKTILKDRNKVCLGVFIKPNK